MLVLNPKQSINMIDVLCISNHVVQSLMPVHINSPVMALGFFECNKRC